MHELISHFGIDWKLLLAQAVNFFILLFILRRFAYRPVVRMLKDRTRRIEAGLEYTKKAEEHLQETGRLREETLNQARGEALAMVTHGEESAKKRKEEIMAEANKKVEGVISDAKRLIEEEKAKMGETVYAGAETLVRSGIAKVLGKMPPEARDAALIQEALKELKTTT